MTMYTSFPSVMGACACTVNTASPKSGAFSAFSCVTKGAYTMSANVSFRFCPTTGTMPVCCGFDPHCGQKGTVEAAWGPTVKVTVMVCGDILAFGSVTVTWPV